jgi:hypothetical protein
MGFCTVWRKELYLIKWKFYITFSRHFWCGTMCSSLQDAEELQIEQTKILFPSWCSFWDKSFVRYLSSVAEIWMSLWFFILKFSQHSRCGKSWCDVRLMFTNCLSLVLEASTSFFCWKMTSPLMKFWLTRIIWWFQNVFFIIFLWWFWWTWFRYKSSIKTTVIHNFFKFLFC